jgi:hypothetical protein
VLTAGFQSSGFDVFQNPCGDVLSHLANVHLTTGPEDFADTQFFQSGVVHILVNLNMKSILLSGFYTVWMPKFSQ